MVGIVRIVGGRSGRGSRGSRRIRFAEGSRSIIYTCLVAYTNVIEHKMLCAVQDRSIWINRYIRIMRYRAIRDSRYMLIYSCKRKNFHNVFLDLVLPPLQPLLPLPPLYLYFPC